MAFLPSWQVLARAAVLCLVDLYSLIMYKHLHVCQCRVAQLILVITVINTYPLGVTLQTTKYVDGNQVELSVNTNAFESRIFERIGPIQMSPWRVVCKCMRALNV